MSHTTESHRQIHVPRIGMVNVPAAVAERITELEDVCRYAKRALQRDESTNPYEAMDRINKVLSTRVAAEAAAKEGDKT